MPSTTVSAVEIDEAVGRYKTRLWVGTLKRGQPKMIARQGGFSEPVVMQGGFARVFRWTDEGGNERAVRCFYTSPAQEYQQRFQLIDQFLLQNARSITVRFGFHEKGFIVKRGGADITMPLVDMEWVEGETLLSYVDRLAVKKDKAGLMKLVERWVELIKQMRAANFAHGDLSGDNVMVRKDGSLVLIDYDSVFLPAFAGQGINIAGNPKYQHPDLDGRPYDGTADHFAALVIYIAIRALAVQPKLWDNYSMHDQGKLISEELLFKADDYRNPRQSRVFAELAAIGDAHLSSMVQILDTACQNPVTRVPYLVDIIDPEAPQKAALARLKQAIDNRNVAATVRVRAIRDADIALLANYPPARDPAIRRAVDEARALAAQADRLDAALKRRDPQGDAEAVRIWSEGALPSSDVGREYEPQIRPLRERLERERQQREAAEQARQQRQAAALRALLDAINNDDERAIDAAAQNPDLDQAGLDNRTRARTALAARLLEQEKKLQGMLKAQNDAATLNCWKADNFDASSLAKPYVAQVEVVHKRHELLTKIEADLAAPGADPEQILIRLWDDNLFQGYAKVQPYRVRFEAALKFQPLRNALTKKDYFEVVRLWETVQMLPGAEAYRGPVESARQKLTEQKRQQEVQALQELRAVLSHVPRQDQAIVDAWNNKLLNKNDQSVQNLRPAAEAATTRLATISSLSKMLRDEQEQDAALVLWKQQDLANSQEAAALRLQVEQVEQRQQLLNQVEKALHDQNDILLFTIWDESLLRGSARALALAPQVELARRRISTLKALESALANGNDKLAIVLWDKLKVSDLPGASIYDARIRERKQRWLAPRSPQRLEGVIKGDQLHLKWSWPDGLDRVAVSYRPDRFPDHFVTRGSGQWTMHVPRVQYDRRGEFVTSVPPNSRELYVRVFPLLPHDADWMTNLRPAQLHLRAIRTVRYKLVHDQNRLLLEVDAQEADPLPPLSIIKASSVQAAREGRGVLEGRVDQIHRIAPSVYRVPLVPLRLGVKLYLVLVATLSQDKSWLRFEPENGIEVG